MPTIVNTGSTLTVMDTVGLTLAGNGTVAAGGLLDGAGPVGGAVSLLNLGTIAADLTGGTLTLAPATLTNPGTLRAAAGTLVVASTVALTDLSGTTLTGGVWEASGAGTLSLLGGQIVTDNATITVDGVSSTFTVSNNGNPQALEASLGTIGASGVLNVLGGRDFQTTGALEVNGLLTLGGGLAFALNGVTVAATGTVSGFGDIQPFARDDGVIVALGGTLSVPDPASVSGGGTLRAAAGGTLGLSAAGAYAQRIVNDGTVEALNGNGGGTLTIGGAAYQGSGAFLIQGGFAPASATTLDLAGAVSGNVAFDTNYGRLILENSAAYAGTVSGFADTDSIVLKNLGASTASLIGGALVLSGGGAVRRTLSLDVGSLDYSGAVFAVSSAGGDTAITVTGAQPAACYRAGTRIGTARGPVRVEDLRVGDRVKARFAHMAPVTWIGHRRVDCRRHPDPARVWPVRIAAHAFGPSLPRADLWLSPDHALFLEDALIPVKHLINGVTIARMPAATVVYYHLELPEHDVVLAEGLEAESYLENGDRHSFDNAGGAISLHPAFGAWRREGLGCAPLVMTGPALDAARARVAAGAALLARGKPDRRRRGGGSGRSGSF